MSRHLKVVSWSIILSTVVCEDHFVDPDTVYVFNGNLGVFVGGTRLAMPKTRLRAGLIVIEPDSGATEGVLDKGVSGQPDYIHRPDYRSVKIQDSRFRLVSGWDPPLRGRQAWRSGYYVSFLVTDSI